MSQHRGNDLASNNSDADTEPVKSAPSTPPPLDTLEERIDDLIMRLKDCLSHEDNHAQQWGDRCITKVQFKQQMKAAISQLIVEARLDELQELGEFFKKHHLYDQDAAMKLNYHITDRITDLSAPSKEQK